MNIDLRNVSSEFEKNINLVKQKNNIKTNISAVEFIVNSHHSNLSTIEKQRNEIAQLNMKLRDANNSLDEVKHCFATIKKFTK